MNFVGIIPARYASTRLPGKALKEIGGLPMIVRVWQQVCKSRLGSNVYVATDDVRIKEAVESAGGQAIMTAPELPSGTDRCYHALNEIGGTFDFVVNIQGDEPFIDPDEIDLLISHCTVQTEIATLIQQTRDESDIFNPNVVKVVRSNTGKALYFSRAPIPHIRNTERSEWLDKGEFWRHIGMYAYRSDILEAICALPVGNLESFESLEQLRWLENNFMIDTAVSTAEHTLGVDTPEDLETARKQWQEQSEN